MKSVEIQKGLLSQSFFLFLRVFDAITHLAHRLLPRSAEAFHGVGDRHTGFLQHTAGSLIFYPVIGLQPREIGVREGIPDDGGKGFAGVARPQRERLTQYSISATLQSSYTRQKAIWPTQLPLSLSIMAQR